MFPKQMEFTGKVPLGALKTLDSAADRLYRRRSFATEQARTHCRGGFQTLPYGTTERAGVEEPHDSP